MTNLISANLLNKNRLVPAKNKSNYLIPITIFIKVDFMLFRNIFANKHATSINH